jgi:hypothetical protein
LGNIIDQRSLIKYPLAGKIYDKNTIYNRDKRYIIVLKYGIMKSFTSLHDVIYYMITCVKFSDENDMIYFPKDNLKIIYKNNPLYKELYQKYYRYKF